MLKRCILFLTLVAACCAHAQNAGDEEKLRAFLRRWPQADTDRDGVLTMQEARAYNQKRRKKTEEQQNQNRPPAPNHADVKYGEHPLQGFDLWLADPDAKKQPTPLCIYIHGGGFQSGDKSHVAPGTVERFLTNGISFVSMNYRLTEDGKYPYPTPMQDAVRGVQLIRSRATEWNIDAEKIACYGGSAGGGISLWIGFHDELAEPESDDPVSRESSRILAVGMLSGQSTYDMRTCLEWFGVPDLPPHSAFPAFYAIKEGESIESPRVAALAEEASPINHLTKDDPPVYMVYNQPNSKVTVETEQAVWVHHPLLGIKLKEAMDKLGVESVVSSPGSMDSNYEDVSGFLIQKLKGGEK